MKRIFLISAIAGAGTLAASGQTVTAMAEQLVELKLFEQTTGAGYQLMGTGLDSIGLITDNEYQLHSEHFASLGGIKASFNNDPVLTALREMQAMLIEQLQKRVDWWRQQQTIDLP